MNPQSDYSVDKSNLNTAILMLAQLFIGILFCLALIYVARRLWREFNPQQSGCHKGCGCDSPVVTPK
ncbi:MAG: hypothetical protein EAZ32_05265 [Cytophagia bacterium]|nr:MAG: hypothetical protein EAZ46_03430 [Runella sp.]TAG21526.1 MAG: hypothetical protein EAZ38_08005 [Cytophagales bacterium]TAG40787.1 MAG: hypothetical protein EAZ32_05265 [Cytophagia bacterium]TAG71381.1 MAG: hypothetical protein EAZ26_05215 [Runella slithyformis]TAG82290.1 MAG: hypothetical protein EAZ22_05600 [Cytophagales bacterium]